MTLRKELSALEIFQGIQKKDRGILARGISLVESQKTEDFEKAQELLEMCIPFEGKSLRIGITGIPGAGKSTFINNFGKIITEKKSLAVLTIDPSSELSGGSILGDKTRMQDLAVDPKAFIRPSPSLGHLGGVAARTRESILLCETFGFDIIIVETVGIGQSETRLAQMVDFFLLLSVTGAGDDLQGIKRGILEVVDMISVNKADGENLQRAEMAKNELNMALHILRPQDQILVTTSSGLNGDNLQNIYKNIMDIIELRKSNGTFDQRRKQQNLFWLDQIIEQKVFFDFRKNQALRDQIENFRARLTQGKTHPILVGKIF